MEFVNELNQVQNERVNKFSLHTSYMEPPEVVIPLQLTDKGYFIYLEKCIELGHEIKLNSNVIMERFANGSSSTACTWQGNSAGRSRATRR